MKCEECQSAIEDYIDEALAVRTAREVAAHLSSCAICARYHEELKREQAIYASYQRDVDVTPALWASIESRIKQDSPIKASTLFEKLRERFAGAFGTPRFSPAFAAALVLLTVGVTAVVMNYVGSRRAGTEIAQNGTNEPPSEPAPKPNETPNSPKSDVTQGGDEQNPPTATPLQAKNEAAPRRSLPNARPTPERLVREAEQKYVQAIAILSRDVNQRRSRVDPAVLARFDAALSDIDRTIAETKQAARQNPGDPIALQYLLAAYSKKVDALRDMARD
jgi:hypothetical protein